MEHGPTDIEILQGREDRVGIIWFGVLQDILRGVVFPSIPVIAHFGNVL